MAATDYVAEAAKLHLDAAPARARQDRFRGADSGSHFQLQRAGEGAKLCVSPGGDG
jgi:hypothetical protein